MPGLLKIGFTKDLEQRLSGLYTTGVPGKFSIEMALPTESGRSLETAVFERLASYRVPSDREFFQIDLAEAIRLIIGCYEMPDQEGFDNKTSSAPNDAIKPQRLSEIEEEILLTIASGKENGFSVYTIRDEFKRDSVVVSYTISKLIEEKYIKYERRKMHNSIDCYVLIHKGLQYLKDIEMLEEEKIDAWWSKRHPRYCSNFRLADLLPSDDEGIDN